MSVSLWFGQGGDKLKMGREWNIKCLQKERMRGELSKLKKIYIKEKVIPGSYLNSA